VRAERAAHPSRNLEKKYAPNKEKVILLEKTLNSASSPDPFFYPNYKKIDTVDKTPEEIADEILSFIV
jgi:hypothetical protein